MQCRAVVRVFGRARFILFPLEFSFTHDVPIRTRKPHASRDRCIRSSFFTLGFFTRVFVFKFLFIFLRLILVGTLFSVSMLVTSSRIISRTRQYILVTRVLNMNIQKYSISMYMI